MEMSLPLKQREAGLKYLSFWGKILAQNGKARAVPVCASRANTAVTASGKQ